MKESGQDEFVTAIWNLRLFMRILGTWPKQDSRGWYNLVWYVQSVGVTFHMFGPAAGLIVNIRDASKVINNLSVLICLISLFLNWIIFAVRNETIGQLVHFMETDWSSLENHNSISESVPDSKRIMKHHYQSARTFFFTALSIIAFSCSSFVFDSVSLKIQHSNETDSDVDHLFVIPYSWFPVDYNRGYTVQIRGFQAVEILVLVRPKSAFTLFSVQMILLITYHVLFGAQVITLVIVTLVSVSIDNFFVTVTFHLCAQFKILRYFTESIAPNSSRTGCCEIKVRMMIQRHQELLRIAEKIQTAYNYILVVQYATATLCICFLGYTLVMEMEKVEPSAPFMMKAGFLFGAYLVLMFAYCYVSNCLTDQSEAVAMAVYNSYWYKFPRSVRLSFLIVMARADRPVRISGATLLPISLAGFSSLLKASASYLSVLRAMGVSDG